MLTSYPVQISHGRFTAASVTTSAQTVLTADHISRTLLIGNSLDQNCVITYDGTDWIFLPASQGGGLDMVYCFVPSGVAVGIRALSTLPTAGGIIGLTLV